MIRKILAEATDAQAQALKGKASPLMLITEHEGEQETQAARVFHIRPACRHWHASGTVFSISAALKIVTCLLGGAEEGKAGGLAGG